MGLSRTQILLCLGMLITGSINTLSKKAQNDSKAPGLPDPKNNGTSVEHEFTHPWFQTLIMFLGEATCLIGLVYSRHKRRRKDVRTQAERLMVQPEDSQNIPSAVLNPQNLRPVFHWVFVVPTIFDIVGTSLAGIGLIYVDASVWQMLRGSIIIFTGILSKIFLKRKLRPLQWLGMLVTVLGLLLVGISGVHREEGEGSSKAVFGVVLILLSQLASAGQMVVEELFLKKQNFEPLQVVGMEGFFGVILMSVVVLPAMYYINGNQIGNRYENSLDAIYQIKNCPSLLAFSILYLVSIAFYNYLGLAVTKSLTAVHRTLIDACRTILVWIASLSIYYLFTKDFGEPFDRAYGGLQVDGFLFLLIGTALYNEIMDVPCIKCLQRSQEEVYPSLVINSAGISENHAKESFSPVDDSLSPEADENTPLVKRSIIS